MWHVGTISVQEFVVIHKRVDIVLVRSNTVSALVQCAYSIFQNDFLGRTQFNFTAFYSRILPKNWTFDPKMCILLQF